MTGAATPTGFLGVDIGTGSLRTVLVSDDGGVRASAAVRYETLRGPRGEAEQNPSDWTAALATAMSMMRLDAPPASVGLCGQTPTIVFVDEENQPVRPAMTWQDTRASREAAELADALGPPESLFGTNLAWSASNIPARLAWVARHEPETRRRSVAVLQAKDYLGAYLTGVAVSDPWSSKGLCHVGDLAPASAVLAASGWSDEHCPELRRAWDLAGVVSAAAAAETGLAPGTPVSVGWSDALAEILASGCYADLSAFFFSGTSSIVGAALRHDDLRAPGLFNVPRSCAPAALLYGPTQSGGAALAWVARLLGVRVDELSALAASASGSAPVFVPYLSGERAPLWNSSVRALFAGLDESHGPAEIALSVLLSVIMSARHILELVETASAEPIEFVETVGRGVGDPAWEDIARRGCGLSLRLHSDQDMSARGAAMLGAACTGGDLAHISRQLADPTRVVEVRDGDVEESRRLLRLFNDASRHALEWQAANAKVEG